VGKTFHFLLEKRKWSKENRYLRRDYATEDLIGTHDNRAPYEKHGAKKISIDAGYPMLKKLSERAARQPFPE
jgi:hypothetical protein